MVWIAGQGSHDISSGQNLIQSKALTLPSSVQAERGEAAAKEKSAARRGGLMRFKERNCLKIKLQSKAASADGKAAARRPEDLAEISE